MGSGVLPLAMATRPTKPPVMFWAPAGEESECERDRYVVQGEVRRPSIRLVLMLAAGHDAQARHRAISTGQLRGLPRFHLRPINVVVYHGSQRDLVLR